MLWHDSLLNGIALSRVTNERSATSPGPHLFTGLDEHHWRSGLGSRARHDCAATRCRSARVSGVNARDRPVPHLFHCVLAASLRD